MLRPNDYARRSPIATPDFISIIGKRLARQYPIVTYNYVAEVCIVLGLSYSYIQQNNNKNTEHDDDDDDDGYDHDDDNNNTKQQQQH